MRILFDLTHPAHLHFFHPSIKKLQALGHEICLTGRNKDILRTLAQEKDLDVIFFGNSPKTLLGMALTLFQRKMKLAAIVKKFAPDLLVAVGGTFVGLLGKLLDKPTLIFYDTESARLSNLVTYPFATRLCTPNCYGNSNGFKQTRYAGYQELAYLHPEQFKADEHIFAKLGLHQNEPYTLVRFVGWQASHDFGRKRLSRTQKIDAIHQLAKHSRVFVSSENPIPKEMERFRFPLPSSKWHDAVANARLVFGESSTVCSEASILGVPSIFIYPKVELGYMREQCEKWKIVHWFHPDELGQALECAVNILKSEDTTCWKQTGVKIVSESVNVTDFICGEILQFQTRSVRSRPIDVSLCHR